MAMDTTPDRAAELVSIITDLMLDAINRYRQTGDELDRDEACDFAEVLGIDPEKVPTLATGRRRRRTAAA